MTEKKVRGPRKTSPRTLKPHKKTGAGDALRALWKTPEFREKMRLRDEARDADRKLNPWKYTRAGVPDGMRKRDALPLWEKAQKLADRFVQIMKDVGELPADEFVDVVDADGEVTIVAVPKSDTGKAEAALREAFVLAVGPSTQQIKIQAINTVLNFTKSKPESKSKLTLNKAEDFLDEVAKSMSADGAD
jgi:hypothetical protein